MSKKKEVCEDLRQKTIDWHKVRNTCGNGSQLLNVPSSTVQYVKYKFVAFGTIETLLE